MGMNDTKDRIIEYLYRSHTGQSSGLYEYLRQDIADLSLITVKRLLAKLKAQGILTTEGRGRSTRYVLTPYGKLTHAIDAHAYGMDEPDRRFGYTRYQFDLLPALTFDPFLEEEYACLAQATDLYRERIETLSPGLHQKELERFVIELSWKSSKIEGNTYTLLDTERLLLYGEEAVGHSKDEASMILNHKTAFAYVRENRDQFRTVTREGIEQVHALLTCDLPIANNFRSGMVGVTGSTYRPLDNRYQIEEAIEALCAAVERMPHGYAKALVTLLGLSYIQPFEDGNKRTARLVSNAILLAYDCSPLSYRSVSEEEYREAVLVFYELNSLQPFKRLFIEQYTFAADTYLVR